MPATDDLEVIRELLAGKPPSHDVSEHVRGRLSAVIAAEDGPDGRPAGRNARSHHTVAEAARLRRRRLALSSAAAVSALAAGAVALLAVVVPGTGGGSADAAAYVVGRVSSALSAAEPGQIAQMTVTTRTAALYGGKSITTTAREWSNGGQWRLITYSPDGRPLYDEGVSTRRRYTLVSYQARTWVRQSGLGPGPTGVSVVPGPPGCQSPTSGEVPLLFAYGLPGIGSSASSLPSTVARELRAAVSCGSLTSAGRQRVDGIETIELTSRPGSPASETIWVSPSTYLPVRVTVRLALGKLSGRQQTANITWLPATPQNLAKLTVPIPAGFRKVPLAQAIPPILQQFPGGPLQPSNVICRGPDGPTCKGYPGGNS